MAAITLDLLLLNFWESKDFSGFVVASHPLEHILLFLTIPMFLIYLNNIMQSKALIVG